jgi:two-component system sensor histidine kinase MprB
VRSLRSRLAIASGTGVLVVLAVVGGVLFAVYEASLRARTDGTLVHAAEQASSVVRALKVAAAAKGREADLSAAVTVTGAQLQIVPFPQPTEVSGRLESIDVRDVEVAAGRAPAYFRTTSDEDPVRVYTARLTLVGDPVLVRVWRPASADAADLARAGLLLIAVTVGGTGIAAGAARLGAGRVLQPVAELTAAAEAVTRSRDPAARVRPGATGPPRAGTDEVDRLAVAFDTMLAELEGSLRAQRQLVADASHELRTPLTSITTNLDLLAEGAGTHDVQAPALVAAARHQAAELAGLVEDLVDLARYGQVEPHREVVPFDVLVDGAVRRAAARAPRGVRIRTALRRCLVDVDPAAVDRAVTNLVDNAVKWSPDGGEVTVTVAAGRCTVTDAGPGVAEADLPHVFERFYRSATARGLPGSGLGLAIVAQVAEANGGTVAVRSGAPGSRFTLEFPVADLRPVTPPSTPGQVPGRSPTATRAGPTEPSAAASCAASAPLGPVPRRASRPSTQPATFVRE